MSAICSSYTDVNTSSVVLTYLLGTTVLMTRYSECITKPVVDNAEGSWRVARGTYSVNDSSSLLTSDYGFHETGEVHNGYIKWSNGAVWSSFEPYSSYLTKNGIVYLTLSDTKNMRQWTVSNGTFDIGIVESRCNSLQFGEFTGKVIGDYIVWNNIHVWEPFVQRSGFPSYSYIEDQEPSIAQLLSDYETYDYDTYEDAIEADDEESYPWYYDMLYNMYNMLPNTLPPYDLLYWYNE